MRGGPGSAGRTRAPTTPTPTENPLAVTAPETAAPTVDLEPGDEPGGETDPAERRLATERRTLPGLDPLALLAAIPRERPALLWRAPSEGGEEGWIAIGRALRIAPPDGRLEGFDAAIAAAVGDALGDGAGGGQPALRAFFTIAFDPASRSHAFGDDGWAGYAPVEAWLPEILVRCAPERSDAILVGPPRRLTALGAEIDGLTAAALALDGTREPGAGEVANLSIEWAERGYREQVVAALDTLCRRDERHPEHDDDCLTKVVLSHAVTVRPDRVLRPAAILRELRREHPTCFLFAVRPAPGAPVFLGASPERLARIEAPEQTAERRVLSGALAGSAPRGATAEEDEALGRRLLESAKDREEHEIVGDMIAEALARLCHRVDRRPAPVLEKLSNVQHLFTPISGELHPGRGVLDAVAALHPTPAVGGMPRDRALAAIRQLERRPRGLYAGVIGWVAPDGTGDSAVAIRSARVDDDRVAVFAGGGIVRTSDPDVEVAETRLKLAAVLGAMERAVCDEPDRS